MKGSPSVCGAKVAMTLKVIQGLVSPNARTGTEVATAAKASSRPTTQSQTAPVVSVQQSLQNVVATAKSVSSAGEAVITTVRSASRASSSELRSSDDAEKLARKIARDLGEGREEEALFSHSGLDTIGRSGRGGSLL